jgi:hypothetical protein
MPRFFLTSITATTTRYLLILRAGGCSATTLPLQFKKKNFFSNISAALVVKNQKNIRDPLFLTLIIIQPRRYFLILSTGGCSAASN